MLFFDLNDCDNQKHDIYLKDGKFLIDQKVKDYQYKTKASFRDVCKEINQRRSTYYTKIFSFHDLSIVQLSELYEILKK